MSGFFRSLFSFSDKGAGAGDDSSEGDLTPRAGRSASLGFDGSQSRGAPARRLSAPPAVSSLTPGGVKRASSQLREEILHSLIKAVQQLVAQAAKSPRQGPRMERVAVSDGEDGETKVEIVAEGPAVEKLLTALEQACLHGIKTKEFHDQVPFWDMLESLTTQKAGRVCPAPYVALVRRVQQNASLKTPLGKARSFLRNALKDGCLESVLAWVCSRAGELRAFYRRRSLLLHQDDTSILLSVLGSLEHFSFRIPDADDASLDRIPDWPLLSLPRPVPEADLGVSAAMLIRDLTTWKLEDDAEVSQLEAFVKEGGDAFNTSGRRRSQRDPLLDALLDSSGVKIKEVPPAPEGGEPEVYLQTQDYLYSPARPRRKKGSKLFGESVALLVRDVETCRFALLDPSLGVPFIFEEMFEALEKHLQLADLFSTKVSSWRVSSMQRSLEEYQECPPDSDPHVVAATLVLCLRMLPEPLLTYAQYHGFLSVLRIPEPQIRTATLRGLVEGLPLEHRPTLAALMQLLHKASHGEGARLDPGMLADVVQHGVIRGYMPEGRSTPPRETHPEAPLVVRLLIDGYEDIFAGLRQEEQARLLGLQRKLSRLNAVADKAKLRADEGDPACLALLRELFGFLARVEQRMEKSMSVSAASSGSRLLRDDFGCDLPPATPLTARSNSSDDVTLCRSSSLDKLGQAEFDIYATRWERCGFIRGDPGCELGAHGMLALECLVFFTRRFPAVAAEMLFQYAMHARKGVSASFPSICGQVLRLVLLLLRLVPQSGEDRLTIAQFSEAAHWRLLDDEHALEEVFCVAITLLDFLHFHEVIGVDVLPAFLLEVKRELSWALAQGPVTVSALWELWLAMRTEERRRFSMEHKAEDEKRRQEKGGVEEDDDDEEEGGGVLADGAAPAAANGGILCKVETDENSGKKMIVKISREGVRTRILSASDVLRPLHVALLEAALPETANEYDWVRLYGLKRHGASLKVLFDRCRGHASSLLLVMDNDGTVFGGYATHPWHDNRERYYGTGESFLFTFKHQRFMKYTWTRANSYFQLSNASGLAMGGGGHFGLYLDQDLYHGSSDTCSTFGSPSLSPGKLFEVVALEVWGFQTPLSWSRVRSESSGLHGGLVEALGSQNGGSICDRDHPFV